MWQYIFVTSNVSRHSRLCLSRFQLKALWQAQKEAARKDGAWMWQGSDRASDWLTYEFVLNEKKKDLEVFHRRFCRDWEVTSLSGIILQLLKKKVHLPAACVSRQDFLPDIRLNLSALVATSYYHWPCFDVDAESEMHFMWRLCAHACVSESERLFWWPLSSLLMGRHK